MRLKQKIKKLEIILNINYNQRIHRQFIQQKWFWPFCMKRGPLPTAKAKLQDIYHFWKVIAAFTQYQDIAAKTWRHVAEISQNTQQ